MASKAVFHLGHSTDQILTLDKNRRLIFRSEEAFNAYLKVETNHLKTDSSVALKSTKASDKLYCLVSDDGVCAMLTSCSKHYWRPLNFEQQRKVTSDSMGSTIY